MHIRIYFKNKPLFLTDALDKEIEPYAHHDDAVLIDEFSHPAVNSLIHEMNDERIHAGILLHHDLEALKKAFFKKFTVLQAAGGLVQNEKGEWLLILSRGTWNLPKGKLDPGEDLESCAVREVSEETGLQNPRIIRPLLITYHTYQEFGKALLKETHWYLMEGKSSDKLVPQEEEFIEAIQWVDQQKLAEFYATTFPAIQDVFRAAGYLPGH